MVDINDTETFAGADTELTIATDDTETGAGADASVAIGQSAAETGSGIETESDRGVGDPEWVVGHESEFIEIHVFDADTGSGSDTAGVPANPITDSDTAHGTDVDSSIAITPPAAHRRFSIVRV